MTALNDLLGVRRCLLFVNFHHVRDQNHPRFPYLHHRTPRQLREQIELLGRDFEFITPSAARRVVVEGKPLTDHACVLTFDDGLRDHHDTVAPLLAELGIQALFFVNTGPWEHGRLLSVHLAHHLSAAFSYEDLAEDIQRSARDRGVMQSIDDVTAAVASGQYRYDGEAVARVKYFLNMVIPQGVRAEVLRAVFEDKIGDEKGCAERHYMQSSMVATLAEKGHEIGLHSHTHVNLAAAGRALRLEDLAKNLEHLEGATARPIRWISYPYGGPTTYDDDVLADARSIGVDIGLTMKRGLNIAPRFSPMELLRVDTNDAAGGKSPMSWEHLV